MSNNLKVSTKLTQMLNGKLGKYEVNLYDTHMNISKKYVNIYTNVSHSRTDNLVLLSCVGIDIDTQEILFDCIHPTNDIEVISDVLYSILHKLATNGKVIMHGKNIRYLKPVKEDWRLTWK